MTLTLRLPTLEATEGLGVAIAARLFPGAVIALVGPLGAGKTTLVRSIAAALGVDRRQVFSPTFSLVHEYAGRLPVFHFDTYRLPDAAAFADLGAAEYFADDGVCVVEWADRVTEVLPPEYLRIELEHVGETERRAALSATGARHETLLAAIQTSPMLAGWRESARAPSSAPPRPPAN